MAGGEKMEQMEFWRSFFANLEHDLWTVIERGIAIAALDYPSKLREKRDGFAEKLFAPSSIEEAGLWGSANRHSEISQAVIAEHGNSAMTDMDMGSGSRQGYGDGAVEEVLSIKMQLVDRDKPDDDIVKLLERLADLKLTIGILKATEIGKPVNNLRKRGCDKVKSAARKLIRSWKAVADEWVKSLDDVQEEQECGLPSPPMDEGELFASSLEVSQLMDFMDNNMATGTFESPLIHPSRASSRASHSPISMSPFHSNYSRDHSGLKHTRKEACSKDNEKRPVESSFQRKERPEKQQLDEFSIKDKLAAAKRKLQEGYQRAETAKKNRTVQVMDLADLPKVTGGPKAMKRASTTHVNNRPPQSLLHRR